METYKYFVTVLQLRLSRMTLYMRWPRLFKNVSRMTTVLQPLWHCIYPQQLKIESHSQMPICGLLFVGLKSILIYSCVIFWDHFVSLQTKFTLIIKFHTQYNILAKITHKLCTSRRSRIWLKEHSQTTNYFKCIICCKNVIKFRLNQEGEIGTSVCEMHEIDTSVCVMTH